MWGDADRWQKSKNEAEAFKHKYHTNGHATLEEACECYKSYQLDHSLRMDQVTSSTMHKCQVCGTWTQAIATVGPWLHFYLCDDHRNREEVAKLFSIGESWGS